jgi:hypothetical protein
MAPIPGIIRRSFVHRRIDMNKFALLTSGGVAGLVFLLSGTSFGRSVDEEQVVAELNKLRGIEATDDKAELARLNQRMDSAWEFLRKNRTEAVPVVMRELRKELQADSPDQFFLLDAAFFLTPAPNANEESQAQRILALDTLERIDPDSRVIRYNFLELVKFTHALAKLGDARVLPQIDRIFLGSERGVEFFEAPHYVKLPAHSLRVLLYGATGPSIEEHLAKRLNEEGYEKHQGTIVALLVDLGSETSVDAVKRVLET